MEEMDLEKLWLEVEKSSCRPSVVLKAFRTVLNHGRLEGAKADRKMVSRIVDHIPVTEGATVEETRLQITTAIDSALTPAEVVKELEEADGC